MALGGGTSTKHGGHKGGGKGKGGKKSHLHQLLQHVENQDKGKHPGPPSLTFDPQIEAQRRAAQRGLEDLLIDLHRQGKQTRQDFRTQRKDFRVTKRRGKQDLGRTLERGLLGVHQQREDQQTSLARGQEDFGTKLSNLVRTYTTQGRAQGQAANAQGVYDRGTLAAGAVARQRNFNVERQPLQTGLQRLREDTQTNLQRLGTQAGQLRQDYSRGRGRLKQDVRHDLRLARQDKKRTLKDIKLQRQRGIREQAIGNEDYLQSEIFNARQNNPGAFSKRGRRTGR